MELKALKKRVEISHQELSNYTKTYTQKFEAKKKEILEKNKENFAKDPSSVDLQKVAKDVFYVSAFHQSDIRLMQANLLSIYRLYKELGGNEEFSSDIVATIALLKQSLPKQMFIERNGEFQEIEEGALEKQLQIYEERNYFKHFESQLSQMLNE